MCSAVRPHTRHGSSWTSPPSMPPMRKPSRPTLEGKPRPPATLVVVTTLMISPHPSNATTGGTRTRSAVGRRWSPWPTMPPDLSPASALHARNTSRRRSSPPAYSMGVGKASSQGLRHHEGLHLYHPRPIGQGSEACPKGWRPSERCPGGRQRVPRGRALPHDLRGLLGVLILSAPPHHRVGGERHPHPCPSMRLQ